MIGALALGFGVVAAAGLAIAVLEALTRRGDAGAGLVLGAAVLDAALGPNMPALLLGTAAVKPTDVVFTLVLAAAIARLLRVRRFANLQRWLVLFGILLLLSLVRGIAEFGLEASVVDFRPYLAFASPALYIATFPPSAWLNDRIGRIWLAMTVPMMALVCLRWLSTFAGIGIGALALEYSTRIRALNGPQTFFLCAAALLAAPALQMRGEGTRTSSRLRLLGVLLLPFLVLLNRRTAWLALLVGGAVLLLHRRRLGRREAVILAGAAVLIAGSVFVFPRAVPDEDVATAVTDTGTLEWRVQGWASLTRGAREHTTQLLVGLPFGSGYTREVNEHEKASNPHSFYLQTLLRTGIIGVVALIVLTGGPLRALWRMPPGAGGLLPPGTLASLLAMQLVWFLTWQPGIEQGLVTGLAASTAAARLSRRPAAQIPRPPGGVIGPGPRDLAPQARHRPGAKPMRAS